MPLIFANLIAGAVRSFSFAMLEVSDSLILAPKSVLSYNKGDLRLLGRIAMARISRARWAFWASALGLEVFSSPAAFLVGAWGSLFRE